MIDAEVKGLYSTTLVDSLRRRQMGVSDTLPGITSEAIFTELLLRAEAGQLPMVSIEDVTDKAQSPGAALLQVVDELELDQMREHWRRTKPTIVGLFANLRRSIKVRFQLEDDIKSSPIKRRPRTLPEDELEDEED